ncbi:hypothetical protein DFO70_11769 [Cytobacillus firmus]|uniref:Uncharacterized protein n=2 Tax=Cytobacillus TaxID=2675230 RepID=A0A366JKF7_CYTFI|nr:MULTISPECIES: hypothetical protein [Cytobacillus]RBP87878.1 hypothetical protein DFO70_11769 [Cytobacillus firmus]TDX39241.1 hypothetical protein DFO72_11171 [Cytobacillus oceanisediminis]
MAHGEVKVWYMTEEERLAYIKKHPIRPAKNVKKSDTTFANLGTDYRWRSKKGTEERYGK